LRPLFARLQALTNTILANQMVGITVTVGNTATLSHIFTAPSLRRKSVDVIPGMTYNTTIPSIILWAKRMA